MILNKNNIEIKHYGNGVYRLRGIYDKTQLSNLYKFLEKKVDKDNLINLLHGKVLPMLFDYYPDIKDFLITDKLLSAIENTLDIKPEELKISSHSDYHINTLGGWHRDLGDGTYASYSDAANSKIYKFALIKQNPLNKINLSTQFFINKKIVKPNLLDGDVILFPTYILHRGYPGNFIVSNLRRILFRVMRYDKLDYIITNLNKLFIKSNREAVFFSFGLNTKTFQEFELTNIRRAKDQIKNQIEKY